jgi:hypothetical protein
MRTCSQKEKQELRVRVLGFKSEENSWQFAVGLDLEVRANKERSELNPWKPFWECANGVRTWSEGEQLRQSAASGSIRKAGYPRTLRRLPSGLHPFTFHLVPSKSSSKHSQVRS